MESSTEWISTTLDVTNTTVNDSVDPLEELQGSSKGLGAWMTFNLFLYALICAAGVVGNVLVIYVVLRWVNFTAHHSIVLQCNMIFVIKHEFTNVSHERLQSVGLSLCEVKRKCNTGERDAKF